MITLMATVYLYFPDDIEGDDPLRDIYTPYDAERDIARVLMQRYPHSLRHETSLVECVDAQYEERGE